MLLYNLRAMNIPPPPFLPPQTNTQLNKNVTEEETLPASGLWVTISPMCWKWSISVSRDIFCSLAPSWGLLEEKVFFLKKKNQSPTIMFSDLPTREKSAQSVKQRSEPLSCLFVKGFPSSCFLITTWGRGWGEPLKRSPFPRQGLSPSSPCYSDSHSLWPDRFQRKYLKHVAL